MKLDKLNDQLDGRQKGFEAVFGAAPETPAKQKPTSTSKRSSWKMRAWFVRPDTASRLRAYVNRQQEAGEAIDASDVVDEAITAWLDEKGA